MRDLELTIEAGQVYGLLGPNGSGKSTTLKIILGLISPTRGSTEIFGRPSREVASRKAVGFLPENPYFYKYLTGAETLRFHGKLCGLGGSRLKKRIGELFELVGLTNARGCLARRDQHFHLAARDRRHRSSPSARYRRPHHLHDSSKPVPRFEYLAGVLLLLAISTLVMSALFFAVLFLL